MFILSAATRGRHTARFTPTTTPYDTQLFRNSKNTLVPKNIIFYSYYSHFEISHVRCFSGPKVQITVITVRFVFLFFYPGIFFFIFCMTDAHCQTFNFNRKTKTLLIFVPNKDPTPCLADTMTSALAQWSKTINLTPLLLFPNRPLRPCVRGVYNPNPPPSGSADRSQPGAVRLCVFLCHPS